MHFFSFVVESEIHDSLITYMQDIDLSLRMLSLQNDRKFSNYLRNSDDTLLIKLYSEYKLVKKKISSAITLSENECKKRGISLSKLEEESESILQHLLIKSQKNNFLFGHVDHLVFL